MASAKPNQESGATLRATSSERMANLSALASCFFFSDLVAWPSPPHPCLAPLLAHPDRPS